MSATDNLGPHLLGRNPLPPDPRDYDLADYLEPRGATPPADASYADKTIRELASEGVSWALFLQIWALLKQIAGVTPTPLPPAPGPAPPPAPPPPSTGDVVWECPDGPLDQGQTPHCVGFAWTGGFGNCLPIDDHYTDADGDSVYYAAKVIDGEPKAEDGSNTRSGAQAMQQRGRLKTYAFASTAGVITAWLRAHGPVIVGTDWYEPMFTPDRDGYLRPGGSVAGGHEWTLVGHLPNGRGVVKDESYVMQNSWSDGWGDHGRAYIRVSDFARLLAGGGDACAAAEVA